MLTDYIEFKTKLLVVRLLPSKSQNRKIDNFKYMQK